MCHGACSSRKLELEGQRTRTYAELYEWLMPGELLDDPPPESWCSDWIEASADEFR